MFFLIIFLLSNLVSAQNAENLSPSLAIQNPERTIRIAWTFDDGPKRETSEMWEMMQNQDILQTTWYIQRDLYEKNSQKYATFYREIIAAGGEVAIHAVHPKLNHASWMPGKTRSGHCYHSSIKKAIRNFKKFKKQLQKADIETKFVRLPTGLHTEILDYLHFLGVPYDQAEVLSREVIKKINDENYSILSEEYQSQIEEVYQDAKKLINAIHEEGMHLWGGGLNDKITPQTWEAESSGTGYRMDNITEVVDPEAAKITYRPGLFERLTKQITSQKKVGPRSLVILAHDISSVHTGQVHEDDVQAVEQDIERMKTVAKENNLILEYYTMSDLYTILTGKAP